MQMILMAIMAALLVVTALIGQGLKNPAQHGDRQAVTDTTAQEYVYYGGAPNMTAAINTDMERRRLTNIEQTLVEICRETYWQGQQNGCSGMNEAFTWSFMLNNGATGSLYTVQGMASSGVFSCASPGQYGVYMLNQVYSTTDLTGYTYNLNKADGSGVISGQPDPCAYADIVN